MEKKQYDEIVDLLCNAERDDLVSALSGTTGFDRLERMLEQVRNDLAAAYKTITELRGQVAELEASNRAKQGMLDQTHFMPKVG
jgi:hypothetical protein